MGKVTEISWTDHTFNPWIGCTKVSPGCKNCYAANLNTRWGHDNWGPGKPRRRTSLAYWNEPIKWAKSAHARAVREKVFTASLADIFDSEAPIDARRDLWQLIDQTCYALDWQIVTKRPERIKEVMKEDGLPDDFFLRMHCWLLTCTENQEQANARIPHILQIPSAIRGISAEPLLGPIDLREAHMHKKLLPRIDWVIVGGESGPGARPFHAGWAESIVEQCAEVKVACFVKQLGAHVIQGGERRIKRDKKGGDMHEWPHEIRVRQFPVVQL